MKKKVLKQIRSLAAEIPIQFMDSKMTIKGSEILRHSKNAKDKESNPIEPDKWYSIPTTTQISNYRRLNKAIRSMGVAGVRKYVDEIIMQQKEMYTKHSQALNIMAEQKFEL